MRYIVYKTKVKNSKPPEIMRECKTKLELYEFWWSFIIYNYVHVVGFEAWNIGSLSPTYYYCRDTRTNMLPIYDCDQFNKLRRKRETKSNNN